MKKSRYLLHVLYFKSHECENCFHANIRYNREETDLLFAHQEIG